LKELHENGTVYKHLNPRNILVEGAFKIRQQFIKGEPVPPWKFVAPEVTDKQEDTSNERFKADVYSLGQIIQWLCCITYKEGNLTDAIFESFREVPLLSKMLSKKSYDRPSLDELFQYEWFGYEVSAVGPLEAQDDRNIVVSSYRDEQLVQEKVPGRKSGGSDVSDDLAGNFSASKLVKMEEEAIMNEMAEAYADISHDSVTIQHSDIVHQNAADDLKDLKPISLVVPEIFDPSSKVPRSPHVQADSPVLNLSLMSCDYNDDELSILNEISDNSEDFMNNNVSTISTTQTSRYFSPIKPESEISCHIRPSPIKACKESSTLSHDLHFTTPNSPAKVGKSSAYLPPHGKSFYFDDKLGEKLGRGG